MSVKESLLELLEQNKGSFVSSSVVTGKLSVSRNAIWKAVNELRQAGYDIDSVPNKGYMLSTDSDIISPKGIEAFLINKSLSQSIVVFDEADSTNVIAKLNLVNAVSDKKIFVAKQQTGGKGHGNTNFQSPEGGVYLSIIASPKNGNGEYKKASEIGKKVLKVLKKEIGSELAIDKKNNGIYSGEEKICGILTEYIADLETGERSNYIIGIGIQPGNYAKNRLIAKLIEELC